MKISLLNVPGYYNTFEGDRKTMIFKLDDNSFKKITDMFELIGEKLNIELYHYSHDDNNGNTYFKIKVSDNAGFRNYKDKTTNTIPNEKAKYNCRVLLQIQFVYYNNNKKNMMEDVDYNPQIFLQQDRNTSIIKNKLLHDVLDFTDTEPESESEEEEFNEDTVKRHKNYILITKSLKMSINYT